MVSKWIKQLKRGNEMKNKRNTFNIPSGQETAKLPILEREHYKWIIDKRELGACISGFVIQQKAIEIYPKLYANSSETLNEFRASSGWLTNFCKRRNLVLRHITTKGRAAPKNATASIKNFFKQCQQMVNVENYAPNEIINMDETLIYLDFPCNFHLPLKVLKS